MHVASGLVPHCTAYTFRRSKPAEIADWTLGIQAGRLGLSAQRWLFPLSLGPIRTLRNSFATTTRVWVLEVVKGDQLAGVVGAKIKLMDFETTHLLDSAGATVRQALRRGMVLAGWHYRWQAELAWVRVVRRSWHCSRDMECDLRRAPTGWYYWRAFDLPSKQRWVLNVTINYLCATRQSRRRRRGTPSSACNYGF